MHPPSPPQRFVQLSPEQVCLHPPPSQSSVQTAFIAQDCLQPPPSHDALQSERLAQICTQLPVGQLQLHSSPCLQVTAPATARRAAPRGPGPGSTGADATVLGVIAAEEEASADEESDADPHLQPETAEASTNAKRRAR